MDNFEKVMASAYKMVPMMVNYVNVKRQCPDFIPHYLSEPRRRSLTIGKLMLYTSNRMSHM